ncbi:MAG: type III secretion system inner membrane ring subunit SctD [Candidatus Protochlamydia sp.]|nr:type III secretion system inner membrane ring subunit SctD [Candidatus Protochlamydia sp.]
MVARLVAEEGDLKGLIFSLDEGDEWIIGRDPDESSLVIQDPLVSRKHLIARRSSVGIFVENLSDTNPALVNDEKISSKEPRLLQQGDTIKIGNELFRYYSESSAHILDDGMPSGITPVEFDDHAPSATARTPPLPIDDLDDDEDREDSDTIFDEEEAFQSPLAEINFGITETGRWLLKVIGGPNNGAEFYMQAGHSYILGTDPHTCDIVFHDTSVSRQHAKITVTADDTLVIEDLRSRNGVLVSGAPLDGKDTLSPSMIVTIGTTSFVVYDREGEMQTIISPLLPSIVKVLQNEEEKPKVEKIIPVKEEAPPAPAPKPARHLGPLVLLSIITGLFVLAGLGTRALFESEPIVTSVNEKGTELVQEAVEPFPAVRFSFNKNTGNLLLVGHVNSAGEKSQLMYNLQGLKFIKNIDDSGIIIDEYVWQEINSVLANNPAWRGITIHSPAAGQFVLSGYLATRKEAELLSDDISMNFPYLDLLKKQIVVEEDVIAQINAWLQELGLKNVVPKMTNGEVSLTGSSPTEKAVQIAELVNKIKKISGVRLVTNYVKGQASEVGIINISDRYEVTGHSRLGQNYTVVINGRILSEGDNLDGMTIKSVKPGGVLLEKDGTKYRIDFNR